MAKFRFGIVGVGSRGIRTFGMQLRARYVERGELVAIADLGETRLAVAARRLEVETSYRSADELIAAPDIDVVVITTPDHTHTEIALSAMAPGKHVICEKPVATTIEGANRLLEASRSFKQSFLVGFVLRVRAVFRGDAFGDRRLKDWQASFRSGGGQPRRGRILQKLAPAAAVLGRAAEP